MTKAVFYAFPMSKDLDQQRNHKSLGSVVHSIVSLTSSLMTNTLTVVAKIFSKTLIDLLQKCEYIYQCICYISR